jgi:hypothetical protein
LPIRSSRRLPAALADTETARPLRAWASKRAALATEQTKAGSLHLRSPQPRLDGWIRSFPARHRTSNAPSCRLHARASPRRPRLAPPGREAKAAATRAGSAAKSASSTASRVGRYPTSMAAITSTRSRRSDAQPPDPPRLCQQHVTGEGPPPPDTTRALPSGAHRRRQG